MLTIDFGSGFGPSGALYTLKCTYAHCTLKSTYPWLHVRVDIWTPDGHRAWRRDRRSGRTRGYMAPRGACDAL